MARHSELVTYRVRDRVAVLTMSRPSVRNAIDGRMAAAIEAAMDRAEEDDDAWSVVLASSTGTFCSGADLRVVAAGRSEELETPRGGFAGLVRRVRTKPLVAAVEGAALAGGCEIALACDLVVASEGAVFGLPETRWSLLPVAGGLARLPRLVPPRIAMEMVLTGLPISARRAAELGLVNRVTVDGQALTGALELAAAVNLSAPLAVRAARQAIIESQDLTEDERFDLGEAALASLQGTEDHAEGPQAFLEKRAPRWQGR